jgi:photosynthetic reaction center cytochrome c subunit
MMKLRFRRTILGGLATAVASLLCAAFVSGQAAPAGQNAPAPKSQTASTPKPQTATAQKQPMAEDVLKNVQVLKGIPLDEFMGTMGFFAAALDLNCIDCHVPEATGTGGGSGDFSKYADDTPMKETTRKMILMVRDINKNNFAGQTMVTCYTCHRSNEIPLIKPSLAEQYGEVPPIDPNDVVSEGKANAPGAPSADQILDKYIQAIGGAQRLATLTSMVAKGTYSSFETADSKVPAEVYAKAPNQRMTVAHIHSEGGIKESTVTYDGKNGWMFARTTTVPMLTLTGGNLDGAKADAELTFPGGIKQDLANLNANYPETDIDDKPVSIVSGTVGKSLVKLYFDKKSGLLVRQVRNANTIVGPNPTQIDYSDYRAVSGIQIPFHWVVSWTDNRATWDMTDVQVNVPIDAAKFAKP